MHGLTNLKIKLCRIAYLLTPCSTVLPEKLLWNPTVYRRIPNSPLSVLIISQINPTTQFDYSQCPSRTETGIATEQRLRTSDTGAEGRQRTVGEVT